MKPVSKSVQLVPLFYREFEGYIHSQILLGDIGDIEDLRFIDKRHQAEMDAYDHTVFAIETQTSERMGFVEVPIYRRDHLTRIYISPRYRRRGIGSQVMNLLRIGHSRVNPTNLPAISFYRKNGFSVDTPKDECDPVPLVVSRTLPKERSECFSFSSPSGQAELPLSL